MADELESGVATEQPAATTTDTPAAEPSLRDTLRTAFTDSQDSDAQAESEGRVRGPDGRFLPRAGDPATSVDDPAAAKANQPTDPAAQQQAQPTAAPQHWPDADKAAYAALAKIPGGQQIQARWLERETQFQRAYTDVTQRLKGAEPVMKHFEPHLGALQKAGLTPEHYVGGWLKVEQRLMQRDPAVFAEAVKAYGFDPAAVIQALGGQAGQQAAEPEYTDPKVAALEKQLLELRQTFAPRIEALQTHITSQQERDAQTAHNAQLGKIDSFAQAKSADGQLTHPHFAEVMEDMVSLASAERHAGREPDLDKLYETATWANPTVRTKVLAEQRRADDTKRAAEAKVKAAAARTAGASVTGNPSAGQTPTARNPNASLRDTLRESFREVTSNRA